MGAEIAKGHLVVGQNEIARTASQAFADRDAADRGEGQPDPVWGRMRGVVLEKLAGVVDYTARVTGATPTDPRYCREKGIALLRTAAALQESMMQPAMFCGQEITTSEWDSFGGDTNVYTTVHSCGLAVGHAGDCDPDSESGPRDGTAAAAMTVLRQAIDLAGSVWYGLVNDFVDDGEDVPARIQIAAQIGELRAQLDTLAILVRTTPVPA